VKARGPKKLELVKTEKKNEKEKNEEGAETENKKTTWPKVLSYFFGVGRGERETFRGLSHWQCLLPSLSFERGDQVFEILRSFDLVDLLSWCFVFPWGAMVLLS
jgi:hypothetical protein